MKIVDYIQENELFCFNRLKCLRNEYYHNQCSECIDICPQNAFGIVQNKLVLDTKECTGCSVCIGVCPSEALISKNFDPNEFIEKMFSKDENRLSCKSNTACLSVFDTHHYITLVLEKDEDIFCDLSECRGCILNRDDKTLNSILKKAEEANRFLKMTEDENSIIIQKQKKEFSRRDIFGKIFKEIKEYEPYKADKEEHKREIPKKLTLLKNALKKRALKSDKNVFEYEGEFDFTVSKKIDENCTNCGECVQFCPTGSLFYSSDTTKIFFQSGKCINCSICDDICKEKAIKTDQKNSFDISSFAFDRAEILIQFRLEICKVCKCAFSYKEGELICPRCEHFETNYQDIFKLAGES